MITCDVCMKQRKAVEAIGQCTQHVEWNVCPLHFLSAQGNGFAPQMFGRLLRDGKSRATVMCDFEKRLSESDIRALIANDGNCQKAGLSCRIHGMVHA